MHQPSPTKSVLKMFTLGWGGDGVAGLEESHSVPPLGKGKQVATIL